jgi:hypothetical protein
MFEKYKQYWNDYGLETLAILSIIIIIVLFIYNWFSNKKGTYSEKPISKFNLPPKDSFYNYRQHTVRDSKLELLTKNHLETIFQKPFFKIRPEFLKYRIQHLCSNITIYLA